MKIAVFTDAWPPQINGVVTHLMGTLPLLAKHHEVHVCTFDRTVNIGLPDSVSLHTVGSIPIPIYPDVRGTNPWAKDFEIVMREVKPDIIHVHTPGTVGYAGVTLARKLHIPLVMTFHSYFADPEYLKTLGLTLFGLYKNSLLQKACWELLGLLYNKADVIISPSETTTADIQNHFKPTIRYETISPGVNIEKFHKPTMTDKEMRSEFGIEREYYLYVGRLSKEKNIDELIEAFYRNHLWRETDLVIVGSGPAEGALQKLVQQHGLQKHVIFVGKLTQKALQRSGLYNRAIAFVSMSTSETYGMTYVEAMAAGSPIIVVRAKAAADIFDANGEIVAPHDVAGFGAAMASLYEENTREFTRAQSLRIAAHHSVEKTVEELSKVYATTSSHAHPAPQT